MRHRTILFTQDFIIYTHPVPGDLAPLLLMRHRTILFTQDFIIYTHPVPGDLAPLLLMSP
jgi:NAD/NADP transhydrogenase alpha subunit